MFGITVDDVIKVFDQLKDRYDLILTTTSALDEGFTIDCPIIVGKAHDQVIELYEYGGDFVLDVMDAEQTKGTHWHPNDVEGATDDIVEFMEGKSDYKMSPFKPIQDFLASHTTFSRFYPYLYTVQSFFRKKVIPIGVAFSSFFFLQPP